MSTIIIIALSSAFMILYIYLKNVVVVSLVEQPADLEYVTQYNEGLRVSSTL
jgi:hypothetical protein